MRLKLSLNNITIRLLIIWNIKPNSHRVQPTIFTI